MRFKNGVTIGGLNSEIIIGMLVAKSVYSKYNIDFVITCGTDGVHGAKYSEHYKANAIDIRTSVLNKYAEENNLSVTAFRRQILDEIEDSLPKGFMILDETTHFHLAWKPQYGDR